MGSCGIAGRDAERFSISKKSSAIGSTFLLQRSSRTANSRPLAPRSRHSSGSPQQSPHGLEDLDRVAALEQQRIDTVAEVAPDVRRGQDDRLSGSEEVRQL